MRRVWTVVVLGVLVLGMSSPAWAQAAPAAEQGAAAAFSTGKGLAIMGVGLGAAVAVLGGALGIGMIGSRATEAIARQPEAAGSIFLAWLLPAAMIEGGMLFGIVISLLALLQKIS